MPYQTYQIFLNIYNESKKRKEMEEKINKKTNMISKNTDMISKNTNDNTWSIYNIFSK